MNVTALKASQAFLLQNGGGLQNLGIKIILSLSQTLTYPFQQNTPWKWWENNCISKPANPEMITCSKIEREKENEELGRWSLLKCIAEIVPS